MADRLVAVWLSRHPYPPELLELLPSYDLVHVRGRWQSPEDAYLDALLTANRAPDILFYVAPTDWRDKFVRYVQGMSPRTLLIRLVLSDAGEQLYFQTWYDERGGCMRARPWILEGALK